MLYKTPVEVMAAASPALLAKGCVNVVSLEGIRCQAADRWPRIRDGVYARMEYLLRQKLGPTDFFTRIDENSYLVTMPGSETEEVNVICLRVAYDLYTSFIGRCSIGNVHVMQASSAPDNSLALHPLSHETIIGLAAKAGISDLATTPTQIKSPIVAIKDRTAFEQLPSPPGPVTTYKFAPYWAAPLSVVTTYICEPKTILSDGSVPISIGQLSEKERVRVELSCLHAGIAQLSKCARRGRFLLGVNLSFGVLGSPAGRMEFLSVAHELSAEYRQYLEFCISHVPPGVAQTRLNNMVTMLRPFGRGVAASIAPGSRIYSAYQGIGLRGIGLDLHEYSGTGFNPVDDMRQLASAAKAMKVGTFLMDVSNRKTLLAAAEANIQMLHGPIIAPVCNAPTGMWRLTWADVLNDRNVVSI